MLAFVRRAKGVGFRDRIPVSRGLAAALSCALCCAACGFPSYTFSGSGAGTGGAGGNSTLGGAAGASAGAGAEAGAGAAGSGAVGGSGAAGGASGMGSGGGSCTAAGGSGGAPALASHCSDGKKDGDETGQDCGGPSCLPCFHSEPCQHDTDCISNTCTAARTCAPLFELDFATVVSTRDTYTLQFRLRLQYLGTTPAPLNALAIRYYFSRGDVAEPVVPFATLAVLNGITAITSETQWNLVRVVPDPVVLADTYLEITFSGQKVLLQNDSIELTQSIQAGDAPGREFDQNTHYSYQPITDYMPEEHGVVLRNGQLVWGTPPPYTVPAGCFYTGVNFAGPALTASGLSFRAGDATIVQFAGMPYNTTSTMLTPNPAAAYLPMLQSAIILDAQSATLSVPNGDYWFYPYVISGDGANQADLLVQAVPQNTFTADTVNGAPAWAKLGPYRVSVTKGTLEIASSGGPLRVAGAELYQVAQ